MTRFCAENGIKVWNFNAWKQRLNGAAPASWRMQSADETATAVHAASSFVEVPMQVPPRTKREPAWIEVSSAAGIVIRVPSENLPALRMVLETLAAEHENA